MKIIQKFHDELVGYIGSIEKKFIAPFDPVDPSVGPDVYEFEVKSYCVLAHAAFEGFYEQVALHLMNTSIDNYIKGKKLNCALLSLLTYCDLKIEIDLDERNPEVTTFDQQRKYLEDIRRKYSVIINMNHGTSIKDLRKMLSPVGIDIKEDVKWKSSLMQLVNARHLYAHKLGMKKVISPEDAKNYVDDCLEMANNIKVKAEKIIK